MDYVRYYLLFSATIPLKQSRPIFLLLSSTDNIEISSFCDFLVPLLSDPGRSTIYFSVDFTLRRKL